MVMMMRKKTMLQKRQAQGVEKNPLRKGIMQKPASSRGPGVWITFLFYSEALLRFTSTCYRIIENPANIAILIHYKAKE